MNIREVVRNGLCLAGDCAVLLARRHSLSCFYGTIPDTTEFRYTSKLRVFESSNAVEERVWVN